jgi:hypothetical protein
LLLARGVSHTGIHSKEVVLYRDDTNEYTLKVTIRPQTAQVVERWSIQYIVPKLSEKATVSLEVKRLF